MSDLEKELAELRKTYINSLSEKFKAISETLISENPDLKKTEFLVHKMAGSSGTYGFRSLGTICAFLEDILVSKYLEKITDQQKTNFIKEWLSSFQNEIKSIQKDMEAAMVIGTDRVEKELEELKGKFFKLPSTSTKKRAMK